MSNKNQYNSGNKRNDKFKKIKLSIKNAFKGKGYNLKPDAKTEDSNKENKKTISNWWKYILKIKHCKIGWNVFINFGILGVTFLMLLEAKRTNEETHSINKSMKDNAEYANKIAKQSLDDSREANKKALDAQIVSLKETQRQFSMSNAPYLQIGRIEFNDISKGYNFEIDNLGNYPVKILSYSTYMFASERIHKLDKMIKFNAKNNIYHYYLVRGGTKKLTSDDEDSIVTKREGTRYTYLCGRVIYQNLIGNSDKMKYEFVIEGQLGEDAPVYLYNEYSAYLESKNK